MNGSLRRTGAFALLLLGSLLALGAQAQTPIALGETARSALGDGDFVLDDGSFYDLFTFEAEEGTTYAVTLRSDDFDAFLALFYDLDGGEEIGASDDFGEGTDSRVVFTADRDAVVYVRANSLFEEETGAYSVHVELAAPDYDDEGPGYDDGTGWAPDLARARHLTAGESVNATLSETSPVYADGTYYAPYLIELEAGDTVRISQRSDDFDSYLMIGYVDADGLFVMLESNDDGGDDLNSEIVYTAPGTDTYVILANALSPGESGAYTLSVSR